MKIISSRDLIYLEKDILKFLYQKIYEMIIFIYHLSEIFDLSIIYSSNEENFISNIDFKMILIDSNIYLDQIKIFDSFIFRYLT